MRMVILCVCVLSMAIGCSFEQEPVITQDGSAAKNLGGLWVLEVENLQHKMITTATIRFTNEKAPSCLGGGWKRVAVESHDSLDDEFFPVTDPLSYEVRGNVLVIGRNEVCDAYLHLQGELKDLIVKGDYVAFGWGQGRLGYFALRPSTE